MLSNACRSLLPPPPPALSLSVDQCIQQRRLKPIHVCTHVRLYICVNVRACARARAHTHTHTHTQSIKEAINIPTAAPEAFSFRYSYDERLGECIKGHGSIEILDDKLPRSASAASRCHLSLSLPPSPSLSLSFPLSLSLSLARTRSLSCSFSLSCSLSLSSSLEEE